MIDYTKTNTNDCEGLTMAQAKRTARYYARTEGVGHVVMAAGRLHPCVEVDAIRQAYGERFQGVVWTVTK